MNNIQFSGLLLLSSVLMGNLFIQGIRKRKTPGIFVFSLMILAMLIHSLGYAFELLSGTMEQMYLCTRIEYIGVAFYPFLILLFAREIADEKRFANRFVLTLFFLMDVVTFGLVNTNSFHHLYFKTVEINDSYGYPILALGKGLWYYVQVGQLYLVILYCVIVFTIKLRKAKGNYRRKVKYALIGVCIPMSVLIIYMLGLGPGNIDITPFSFLFMTLCIIFGLLKHDIFTLTPITYEMIFNVVDEGVMVIDQENALINFNRACIDFFPSLNFLKLGDSVYGIEELREYDFKEKPTIYHLNDKIISVKANLIKSNRVCIYIFSDISESEHAKLQLELLATTDSLTGLYNRRYFLEKMEEIPKNGVLAMIDIDYFKSVNDTYGHIAGDEVLSSFGKRIRDRFAGQLVGRYGGEEFVLYLEEINIKEGLQQIDQLRVDMPSIDCEYKVTISAGLVFFKEGTVAEALDQADRKLYGAKENGRNQCCY